MVGEVDVLHVVLAVCTILPLSCLFLSHSCTLVNLLQEAHIPYGNGTGGRGSIDDQRVAEHQ